MTVLLTVSPFSQISISFVLFKSIPFNRIHSFNSYVHWVGSELLAEDFVLTPMLYVALPALLAVLLDCMANELYPFRVFLLVTLFHAFVSSCVESLWRRYWPNSLKFHSCVFFLKRFQWSRLTGQINSLMSSFCPRNLRLIIISGWWTGWLVSLNCPLFNLIIRFLCVIWTDLISLKSHLEQRHLAIGFKMSVHCCCFMPLVLCD